MWIYGLSNCVCAEVDKCGAALLYCRPLHVRTLTQRGLQNQSTVYEHRVWGRKTWTRRWRDRWRTRGEEVWEVISSATRKYNAQGLSFPRFMISVCLATHLYARVVLLWMLESEVNALWVKPTGRHTFIIVLACYWEENCHQGFAICSD